MSLISNHVLLDHGSGVQLSNDLITSLILPAFQPSPLSALHDGAMVETGNDTGAEAERVRRFLRADWAALASLD